MELYFDNAATTRPLPAVIDAVTRVQREAWGNPSSAHAFGASARRELDDARELLRGSIGASRLALTSGGTEADVLGVLGAARARPPGRVLVGAADHPAVLAQAPALESGGHRLECVPVGPGGVIDLAALAERLRPDVRVVAVLHGHNELGGLADVAELAAAVHRCSATAHVHVDFVQGYGKVPFNLDELGVDSVAISGHKLHGPRGIGFLAYTATARLEPLHAGGGQEGSLRGGTENVAAAVGLAVAAEHVLSHQAAAAARMEAQLETLLARLRAALPGAQRLGDPARALPHLLSVRLPGVVGETLQQRCAAAGLALSTGSACHTGKGGNPVLRAAGLDAQAAREVVRLAVAVDTTGAEVAAAGEVLAAEIAALRAQAGPL